MSKNNSSGIGKLIAALVGGAFIFSVIIYFIVTLIAGRAIGVISALIIFLILLLGSKIIFLVIVTKIAKSKK